MDWSLSSDGYYGLSEFGTTRDGSTMGNRTSCAGYISETWSRSKSAAVFPVAGHVDYAYAKAVQGGDPAYFYVAGAQRFGCGSILRVFNPATNRCVVAYAEDAGPGSRYEFADRAGRRILDSSPAVLAALGTNNKGWASNDVVRVEWGKLGDVPGRSCTPYESGLAIGGSESQSPGVEIPSTCR